MTDAKLVHLGHAGKADGRWRLYAFAGTHDLLDARAGLQALCRFLEQSPDSPVRRYNRPGQDIDALFDVRAVLQQAHHELAIESMPALLVPTKGRDGLRIAAGPDRGTVHIVAAFAASARARFGSGPRVGAAHVSAWAGAASRA
jgi:hypothetical protein